MRKRVEKESKEISRIFTTTTTTGKNNRQSDTTTTNEEKVFHFYRISFERFV